MTLNNLIRSIRRETIPLYLATALFLASPRSGHAESSLSAKYVDYREEGGRIAVRAQYLQAEIDINDATRLAVEGVYDSITGATPTGEKPPEGSDQVPLSQLEEDRLGIVASVSHQFAPGSLRLEYARSKEDDYLSNGYSVSFIRDFNQKNTQVQLGYSFIDDTIYVPWWDFDRKKRSHDFLIGLTQLIDPNTTIAVNFAHGWSDGYMSDPYKIVQKTVEIAPGLDLPLTFPENRPTHRTKDILYINGMHFFENLRGSVDLSLRLYRDGFGINSVTTEVAWYQKIGDSLVLSPFLRYYQQSAADFYYPDLDKTDIVPIDDPDGTPPNYSSDYRLAALSTSTLGLKLVYTHGDRWSLDLTYERYIMRGRDNGATPSSAFPTANTISAGFKLWF